MKLSFTRFLYLLLVLYQGSTLLFAQKISLEMVHKHYLFSAEELQGLRSMNDGLHYTLLRENARVVKCSYQTGEVVDTLFDINWVEGKGISEIASYNLANNERGILFSTEEEQIYRYSFRSNYYVYQFENQILTPVFSEGKQQIAQLSPNGKHVAFVFNNDLYIKTISTSKITRVTSDGEPNAIINGLPDWVYEEEFTLKTAYHWSPDSKKIAFCRFDESEVKEYTLLNYDELYPEKYTYKYPKAGEANSLVSVHIFNFITDKTTRVNLEEYDDFYVPRMKWLPNSEEVCLTVLNRRQNKADLLFANAQNGTTRLFYTETNDRYISEFTDDFITFLEEGESALIMSEKSGYMHLYRHTIDGEFSDTVTAGDWEVSEILAVDEDQQRIFYTSTEVSPLERHVYSVAFDGSGKQQHTHRPGWHKAWYSKNFKYMIGEWSDANTPFEYTLYNAEGQKVRTLLDNKFTKEVTGYYNFSTRNFFQYTNPSGELIYAYEVLPPKFKKNKKYPLLVFVYGGPESQEVVDKWDNSAAWLQYMAQQGYVVVCADNRGTDGRGEDFKKGIYLQLGKLETEDQLALAEFMASKKYIDSGSMAIFGWSYGGYLSLLCMMQNNPVFRCGVSVSPVTNWKFYDTVYTERFMRKPQENESGYENNAPLNKVDKLQGNLLLIHGLADDNVHFQNSSQLIEKVVDENKQIDLFVYPDQNHHISAGNGRLHVYTIVDRFLKRNIK